MAAKRCLNYRTQPAQLPAPKMGPENGPFFQTFPTRGIRKWARKTVPKTGLLSPGILRPELKIGTGQKNYANSEVPWLGLHRPALHLEVRPCHCGTPGESENRFLKVLDFGSFIRSTSGNAAPSANGAPTTVTNGPPIWVSLRCPAP